MHPKGEGGAIAPRRKERKPAVDDGSERSRTQKDETGLYKRSLNRQEARNEIAFQRGERI